MLYVVKNKILKPTETSKQETNNTFRYNDTKSEL